MNKKGVNLGPETVVVLIIILIAAVGLIYGGKVIYDKFFKFANDTQNQTLNNELIDLRADTGSQLLKEKERCDKLNTISLCLGEKDRKTGCFWAKIDNQPSCFSCLAKKSIFGNDYGTCQAYNRVQSDTTFQKLCVSNPCNFNGEKGLGQCLFSSLKEVGDKCL